MCTTAAGISITTTTTTTPALPAPSGGLSRHHLVRRQIWTYEGRQVSSPRFQNLRPEYLSGRAISLSEDAVAILDRTSPKSVRVCDVSTGRPLSDGKASEAVHDCAVVSCGVLDIKWNVELCWLCSTHHGSTILSRCAIPIILDQVTKSRSVGSAM